MYLAKISQEHYEVDDERGIGWLKVEYKGTIRWALPKMRFGAFEMPSKEWIEKYGESLGVWIVNDDVADERESERYLVWDGFTFLKGNLPKEAFDEYPYVRLYFTENWKMLFSDMKEKHRFIIQYIDGSEFRIDRTKDDESFVWFDAKHNHRQEWNRAGTKLVDGFGNSIESTEEGWTFTCKNKNILEMRSDGTKLNGFYVVLKPTIDWILRHAPAFGMGNMGKPVPIMPPVVVEANQGIDNKQGYVSNNPES